MTSRENAKTIHERRNILMKNVSLRLLLFSMMIVLLAGPAWAGGLYLYEVGSADVGLASAGFASRAQDASTLFSNPAGMTRLDTSEFDIGAEAIYLHTKFGADSNTSASNLTMPNGETAAGGNPSGLIPAGGLFYVNKISDNFSAGFGVFGFFGLKAGYPDNWVGRYYVTSITLQGMTLMPSAAYKVSDKVSFGAGLNAMYGTLDEKMAVNNRGPLDPTAPDGSLEVNDAVWGFGGKFGVLFEPTSGTRIGLTYLTQTKLNFTATPTLTNVRPALAAIIGNQQLDLGVRAPQQVLLSVYHDVNAKLAIMGDVGWENWKKFGEVQVSVGDAVSNITYNAKFQDTIHLAAGLQYKLSDPWKLSCGVAYDSSMVNGANRLVLLPIGAMWHYAAGAQYAMSPTMTLSGGYEYVWLGDLPVDQDRGPLAGRVSGDFNNTSMQVLTVLLNWKI
jgi:long-chain fatty acid transport protein